MQRTWSGSESTRLTSIDLIDNHDRSIALLNMTLQQLQYVVALDDHRQFVKAAEACFVTQPTLSMQVRQLEDELDVRLFHRQQPLRPTPEGERLIAQARLVLREADQLRAITKELHGGIAGHYRVGVIPTLAPYLLPLFLSRFAKEHVDVRLTIEELRTSRIIEALKGGSLDLGILVTPLHEPGLEEIPLFQEPFLAYLPDDHALTRRKRISRSDLEDQPIWVLGEGHCFREQMLNLCDRPRSAGLGNVVYESGSIETLKQLVRHGEGLTLVPALSVKADDTHVRRFAAPEPVRQVSLVVRTPFVRRKLLEALTTAIQAVVPEDMLRSREAMPLGRA